MGFFSPLEHQVCCKCLFTNEERNNGHWWEVEEKLFQGIAQKALSLNFVYYDKHMKSYINLKA